MSPFKKVLKDNETLVIEDVFNSTLCQILEGNKIIGIIETGGKESPSEEGVPMGPMGPGGMGQPTGGVM